MSCYAAINMFNRICLTGIGKNLKYLVSPRDWDYSGIPIQGVIRRIYGIFSSTRLDESSLPCLYRSDTGRTSRTIESRESFRYTAIWSSVKEKEREIFFVPISTVSNTFRFYRMHYLLFHKQTTYPEIKKMQFVSAKKRHYQISSRHNDELSTVLQTFSYFHFFVCFNCKRRKQDIFLVKLIRQHKSFFNRDSTSTLYKRWCMPLSIHCYMPGGFRTQLYLMYFHSFLVRFNSQIYQQGTQQKIPVMLAPKFFWLCYIRRSIISTTAYLKSFALNYKSI